MDATKLEVHRVLRPLKLLRLYNNLPAKLQSRKKEISAAELILKAIEFITLLREVLALNPEDDANNS